MKKLFLSLCLFASPLYGMLLQEYDSVEELLRGAEKQVERFSIEVPPILRFMPPMPDKCEFFKGIFVLDGVDDITPDIMKEDDFVEGFWLERSHSGYVKYVEKNKTVFIVTMAGIRGHQKAIQCADAPMDDMAYRLLAKGRKILMASFSTQLSDGNWQSAFLDYSDEQAADRELDWAQFPEQQEEK